MPLMQCPNVPIYETPRPIRDNGTDWHRLRAADWCKGCYGVSCQEVDQNLVAEVRFLHEKAVRCTRDDCQLPFRHGPVEVNGMLKGNFVIITHHHKCSAIDVLQVVLRQCGAESMHLVKFLLHDLEMLLAVRGNLPVANDEEFWRSLTGLNRTRNPATAMEGTGSTDQSLD